MIIDINDKISFDTNCSILYTNKNLASVSDNDKKLLRDIFFEKREKYFENRDHRVIKTLNFIGSMRCNGRCSYCYNADNNNILPMDLTFKTFRTSLNVFMQTTGYAVKPETIRLYGGEPLLCHDMWNILYWISENKNNRDIVYYISSGLYVDDDTFDYFCERAVTYEHLSIGVGVDLGTYPETRIGNISKRKLLDRCDRLIDEGIDTIYVNTVSKNTIPKKLFEEIDEILEKHPNAKFRIAVACDKEYSPTVDIINEIYDLLKDAYSKQKFNLTCNIFPYNDVIYAPKIYKIVDGAYYFSYSPYYCGVFNDMINMLPNGDIIHCHMNPFNIMIDIDDFEYKNELIHNKTCEACEFYLQCRGGCFYRHQILGLHSDNNIYCEWIKKSFILSLYRLVYGNQDINTVLDRVCC